jgi:HAMP domain-containing protein
VREVAANLPQPPGTAVVVVDASGMVLARHPDPQRLWTGKPLPDKEFAEQTLTDDCRGYAELRGLDGIVRLNAIEPLQKVDGKCVYVRIGIPKGAVFAPIDAAFRRDLGIQAGVVALVFILVWFGSDALVLRRLRILAEAARRFGGGDLSARSNLAHGNEEVSRLAMAFDTMADALRQREDELALADRALLRANRALTVLSAGNRAMLKAGDEQTLLDGMCREIVEKGGYPMRRRNISSATAIRARRKNSTIIAFWSSAARSRITTSGSTGCATRGARRTIRASRRWWSIT